MTPWFYSEDGKQLGPVSEEDLASQFKNGRPLSTLVWTKGMAEWKTARDVPAFAPPVTDSTGPAVRKAPTDPWTKPDLIEVAKYQKYIQWLVLARLMSMFMPYSTIVTTVIGIYFIYRLAAALRSTVAWLYIIVAFIPLFGLLALLHLVVSAIKILRAHGIRVSVMGAKMEDFDR